MLGYYVYLLASGRHGTLYDDRAEGEQ